MVTITSQTEGRVSFALQAYLSNQLPSLRAAANAYNVSHATLYRRYLEVLLRANTTANSRKFSSNEEQLLLRKIL